MFDSEINRFEVGDRVVIRDFESESDYIRRCNLVYGSANGGVGMTPAMRAYSGVETFITRTTHTHTFLASLGHYEPLNRYRIEADGGQYKWDDAMLMPSPYEDGIDFNNIQELI